LADVFGDRMEGRPARGGLSQRETDDLPFDPRRAAAIPDGLDEDCAAESDEDRADEEEDDLHASPHRMH
jgi:hypothetical protein